GQFDPKEVAKEWDTHDEPSTLDKVLTDITSVRPSAVQSWLFGRSYSYDQLAGTIFDSDLVRPTITTDFGIFPKDFYDGMQFVSAAAVVPFATAGARMGVLVVDNKWTGDEITNDDLVSLAAVAELAASTLQLRMQLGMAGIPAADQIHSRPSVQWPDP